MNANSTHEISVLGLGPMGTALARQLLRDGARVSVWNRSNEKAEPLRREGASVAPSPAAAVAASPVTIVCVASYEAARQFLLAGKVEAALGGRTLVHLSTGTPQEAREFSDWARRHKIAYLDGAILVTPSQIGGADSALLVSGDNNAYRQSEPWLQRLSRNVTYLGEQPGAAAALDLAFLSHFFGGLLGFYHGARIMETEGLPVNTLGAMIAAVAPALGEIVRHDAEVIEAGGFNQPESSLQNSATIAELILRHAEQARLNVDFPHFATAWFRRGVAAGLGGEDVAALVKLLRDKQPESRFEEPLMYAEKL